MVEAGPGVGGGGASQLGPPPKVRTGVSIPVLLPPHPKSTVSHR